MFIKRKEKWLIKKGSWWYKHKEIKLMVHGDMGWLDFIFETYD